MRVYNGKKGLSLVLSCIFILACVFCWASVKLFYDCIEYLGGNYTIDSISALIQNNSDILLGAILTGVLSIFIFYCLIKPPRRCIATLTKIDRMENRINLKFLIKNDKENVRVDCYVKEDNPELKRGRKFEIFIKEMPVYHVKQIRLFNDAYDETILEDETRILNYVEKHLRTSYYILIVLIPIISIFAVSPFINWFSVLIGILEGAIIYVSYKLSMDDLYDRNIEKHEASLITKLNSIDSFTNNDLTIKSINTQGFYIINNGIQEIVITDYNNNLVLKFIRQVSNYIIEDGTGNIIGEIKYYKYGLRPKYLVRFANYKPYFIREKYNTQVHNNSINHIEGYRIVDVDGIQNYIVKDNARIILSEKNLEVANVAGKEIDEEPFLITKVEITEVVEVGYNLMVNIFLMNNFEPRFKSKKPLIKITRE